MGKMKKTIVLISGISLTLFLGGCSEFDGIVSKIPFVNQNDNQAAPKDIEPTEEEQKPTEETQESPEPKLESQFFNEIEEVDGKSIIQNPLNILSLVNKQFALPDYYAPEDLVRPNVAFSFGNLDIEKSYMRKEAAKHLEIMLDAAKKENIEIFAVSGYRSYERQKSVFDAKVSEAGVVAASEVVAVPGYSEHQTGLAMDVSSRSVNLELIEEFGETVEGKWLANNAHKFGFIVRYPLGKEDITGYQYEPWHFRYVGVQAATVIFEKDITLEEYFDIVEKI
ncbi:M15 family metallopeptidase [Robertmurraya yapensis (ex Hitch et al 2024)]